MKKIKALLVLLGFAAVALVSTTTSNAAGSKDTMVWFGSPIEGDYGTHGETASTHHITYGGNWAVDVGGEGDAKVFLFPKDQTNKKITVKVLLVGYACGAIPWDSAAGASKTSQRRLSRGGYKIVIGVYDDGTLVGKITYAHIDSVYAIGYTGDLKGGTNNHTWAGALGEVGSYSEVKKPDGTYCWQGEHVHVEAWNASGYSCFRKLPASSDVSQGEFIGYLGKTKVKAAGKPCPAGI